MPQGNSCWLNHVVRKIRSECLGIMAQGSFSISLFANTWGEPLSVLDPVMSFYHALYHLISPCLSEGSVISPLQRGINNSQKSHCY